AYGIAMAAIAALAAVILVGVHASSSFEVGGKEAQIPAVRDGKVIYLAIDLRYAGPIGVRVDGIELLREDGGGHAPRFLASASGISDTPFPNMTPVSWPLELRPGSVLNPVFVLQDADPIGFTGVKVRYRLLGIRRVGLVPLDYDVVTID
ncbi:MAG TPA: hypothetical protein VIL38_04545, partial [Thermaerobacter sp.]